MKQGARNEIAAQLTDLDVEFYAFCDWDWDDFVDAGWRDLRLSPRWPPTVGDLLREQARG